MKKIFAYLTLGFTTLTTYAATPLWMRDIQISPDGTEIVFCYKGDIYKVSAKGGTATQLGRRNPFRIHARRQVHPFLRRHTGPGRKCALPQSCHDRAL